MIPALPDERKKRYVQRFGITPYAAEQLTASRAMADLFEAAAADTDYPGTVAGLLLTEAPRLLPAGEEDIPIAPGRLARLAQMMGEGEVSSGAGKTLFGALWTQDEDPHELAERLHLLQISDEGTLRQAAERVVAENGKIVADLRSGKKAAMQALIGRCMKETSGRGNPAVLQKLLSEILGL